MKKRILVLVALILTLSSLTLPITAQVISPGPVSWDPDLTSPGVAITEPFEGYLYVQSPGGHTGWMASEPLTP